MPPEIIALLDKPLSLIAVLFVGARAGMAVEQFVSKRRRAAWRAKKKPSWGGKPRGEKIAAGPWSPKPAVLPAKIPDAADQLKIVMGADFAIQPLLNRSEARLFWELDQMSFEAAPE